MENPRPDKVAKVAALEQYFEEADTVLLTEYRGLDVPALAELRGELRAAGADYKIYKNTLVQIAARKAGLDLDALLVGPTAIAFVSDRSDGTAGDPAAAAKALRDFSKKNNALVIKGGLVDGDPMTVEQLKALADLPPREMLLSQIAGALAAPMQQFASLLSTMPRNLAYGLKELIDTKPADAADSTAAADEAPAETEAEAEPAEAEGEAAETATETTAEGADEPETTDETANPAAEATTDETPADAGSEQES